LKNYYDSLNEMNSASILSLKLKIIFVGADVVGVNCHYGPPKSLETMRLMKAGLEAAGLKCHLMIQPLGFLTPDSGLQGFIDLPEFPFGKLFNGLIR
jgi:hypothetical protein